MRNPDDIYIDFASKISFLEFIQDEFRNANIPTKELEREISLLVAKKQWNIADLSDYVKANPRSFIIFQEIFQLLRFTNAQVIHFVFDIAKLNSLNIEAIYEYMVLNLKYDSNFRKIYLNSINPDLKYDDFVARIEQYNKKYLIAVFKVAVSKYIDKVVKKFEILKERITKSEFEDFSIRFSNYLLNNLKLNEFLASIDVEKFLQNKRIPIDTKSLHGNYPKIKVIKLLENSGYTNIDSLLNKNGIRVLKHKLQQEIISSLPTKKIFCTERYVDGIIKIKDNKLKKFDLVIFSHNLPKYLFEINFYSTEGTKIGINQNEYIDLNNYIRNNYSNFQFYWITDGNYWLTTQGKSRFLNLVRFFDKILNINIFAEHLDNFK
ncbi:MAG: DpnII family type II restriction endonuclease [bacterium]